MLFELTQIIAWLAKYKYFVLFPFAVLEGPIVTVIAGYLSSMNLLNFWIVYGGVGTLMFAAGIADVSFMRFLGFTFLATLIKSMILVQIGFYFGYAYEQIKIYLDYTSYITIALAILLILIYIYFQRRAKKLLENNKNNNL